jgi:dTDP-4-amino-4,6-dideoxygalactose transaminase
MIPFNKPPYTGFEDRYILDSIRGNKISGDGPYTLRCHEWFNSLLFPSKTLLTSSCTHALEMAALLLNINPGDEVILPSYTFVSTANAFALRGAKIVFIDINPLTMNIDESLIEAAITKKTRAIVVVHYAGVACDMNSIMSIAEKHKLFVIEDAAQGMMSKYQNKYLGSIGQLGTYSFHETKNYTSGGEGGLLITNTPELIERSEIIREKGTDRSKFFRGMIDKYSWVDIGSSYLPSDIQAAYLWGQLQNVDLIFHSRMSLWLKYIDNLKDLEIANKINLPHIPDYCTHNAHMFYIKVKDIQERGDLIHYLKQNDVMAVFHYVPLHSSPAGQRYGKFIGIDNYTTLESERLIRLPLYLGLEIEDVNKICELIRIFYKSKK